MGSCIKAFRGCAWFVKGGCVDRLIRLVRVDINGRQLRGKLFPDFGYWTCRTTGHGLGNPALPSRLFLFSVDVVEASNLLLADPQMAPI